MTLIRKIKDKKVNFEFNKEYIKVVTDKIASNDAVFISNAFKEMHPADTADIIEHLNESDRENLIKLNKEMKVQADTAGAAKLVADWGNKEDGAIASELAAKIYNLDIINNNFQDTSYNVTRFLVMSKELANFKKDTHSLITTLIFQVRSLPAALYKSLGGFASNGVNLTKIESYIHPKGFDVAQFYIDFEGHPDNDSVKLALEEMKFFCKEINILGVYKASNFRKK